MTPNENPQHPHENPQDPSRRDFLKAATATATATAMAALSGIIPNLSAQENQDKSQGEPPKLTASQIKEILAKSEISWEKIRELEKTINQMMDHEIFSDWSSRSKFKLQNGGFAKLGENGNLTSTYGVELVINKKQRAEITKVYRGQGFNDSAPFYAQELPKHFQGKELEKVREAYKNFMDQIIKTRGMVNEGLFFNHEEGEVPSGSKVATSYNRIIAVGMVEGWNKEQFRVALEQIFPRKIKSQGIDRKTAWENDGYFPSKLLKRVPKGHKISIFYDPAGQQGNIDGFSGYIRDKEFFEADYSGGKTPLERAKKLYPTDKLRQAMYALNILVAGQFREILDC
jgi:hypothetical protein